MPRALSNIDILNEKPREFLLNVLPTSEDVLRAIQYEKQSDKRSVNVPWAIYENIVSEQVLELWRKASIPTIEYSSIVRSVSLLNKKFLTLLQTDKSRRTSRNFKIKELALKVSSDKYSNVDVSLCLYRIHCYVYRKMC